MARMKIIAAQLVLMMGVGLLPTSPGFAQEPSTQVPESADPDNAEPTVAQAVDPDQEERSDDEDEDAEETDEQTLDAEEPPIEGSDEGSTGPMDTDPRPASVPADDAASTDVVFERADRPESAEDSERARPRNEQADLKEEPPTDDQEPEPEDDLWEIDFDGYLRAQFSAIENDPNYELIGRRDGFSLANVRARARGSFARVVGFNVAVDAAASLPKGSGDEAAGELSTRLKDGFIYWAPHDLLRASVGQFKAPFDAESLQSATKLYFIDRSVGSRGVPGLEGLPVSGLSQGRQVGLRLDSKPYYFVAAEEGEDQGFGISYALALTNGQKDNLKYNDNEKLAYFGRINLHWGDMIQVGGGGFQNERLLGVEPDRISEKSTGWTADVQAEYAGISLLANIVQTEITPAPELQSEQERTARSIQAQIAYEEPFFGFQPAYRIALYDPNVDGDDAISPAFDKLTFHTIGLNYNSRVYPLRVLVNYTITAEENVPVDNNRLDAMVQLVW